MLFLHFFFTWDILTLILASASALDLEEELSELEELFSDSNEKVLLSKESKSDCLSTLAVWTQPLLDFFFLEKGQKLCYLIKKREEMPIDNSYTKSIFILDNKS